MSLLAGKSQQGAVGTIVWMLFLNTSHLERKMPVSYQEGIVRLLLKKPPLDADKLSDYHAVLNLLSLWIMNVKVMMG